MGKLSGKYAIVTGGGKGIGESIVKCFIKDGINGIAVLDYDLSLVEDMVSKLDKATVEVLPIKCDVSNEKQVEAAVSQVVERFQSIDILVNNAGITRDSMFHKMPNESWDAVLNVNLKVHIIFVNMSYRLCERMLTVELSTSHQSLHLGMSVRRIIQHQRLH